MSDARELVVNADDFGRSHGINAGIVRAHRDGIVTSTSLMVRWPAAAAAARLALAYPRLGVGLHLDLGEWAFRDGEWRAVYEVVDTGAGAEVEREARHQLDGFRELLGRDPTHLDSHQHVHCDDVIGPVADAIGADLSIPVRRRSDEIAYCGEFYGRDARGAEFHDAISRASLIAILRRLPAGITELACHPGERDSGDPLYDVERTLELAALCDPAVRAVVNQEGIALRSFRGWASERRAT